MFSAICLYKRFVARGQTVANVRVPWAMLRAAHATEVMAWLRREVTVFYSRSK